MVIDNDDVVTQDCLNCLHPVCMNDTWWHLVSCCGIVDKSELNDLQSHCLVDFIRISSARDSEIRHVTSKTQNITSVPKYDLFLTRMDDLFHCTNLNKKGSATVVWIIFPQVYFNKKLRIMPNFCFVLCHW